MSAEGTPTKSTSRETTLIPANPSPSTTIRSDSPPPAFQNLVLLKLNTKCARLRQGMYLTIPSISDDAPTVLYCPEQPWTQHEAQLFNAIARTPRDLAGGGIVGPMHSVWLFHWTGSAEQLPALDLDDLPDPEKQYGLAYFARFEEGEGDYGGVGKVIGISLTMLKLTELGGGQGRLELKAEGQSLSSFDDLG